jgi:hypothetical protein
VTTPPTCTNAARGSCSRSSTTSPVCSNPDVAHTTQNAGFWLGLWHGLITPVTFVISLFTDHVNIYEVHNNGNWYDFGYVLGLMTAFGGAARSGSAATRARTASAARRRS